MSVTPKRSRTRGAAHAPDGLCTMATGRALQAAREVGEDHVGEHLGCVSEGDRVATHYFASLLPGYVGWRWAVTVARAPRQRVVTVDEVVLLPGPDALRAPEWVPWSERLRPGDLGVGDLLPAPKEDDRLVPAYVDSGDPAVEDVGWELGLGRPRVMSRYGREDVAQRWYDGDTGPDAPMARHAPAHCGTCGFYLPLAGSLRAMFGACGNEFSPADGSIVSADYGCGAHSEALLDTIPREPAGTPIYDDAEVELVAGPAASDIPDTSDTSDTPDTARLPDTPAEPRETPAGSYPATAGWPPPAGETPAADGRRADAAAADQAGSADRSADVAGAAGEDPAARSRA